MNLDLPMYKEAYENIALQIKELNIKDNKDEIRKMEEVIEKNRAQIEAFEKVDYENADHSVWFDEKVFAEHENARYEEYVEPYNANIVEAGKMINELENGMDENQAQLKLNKAKQKELKIHMDNVRKNAESDYKKARVSVVEEWEKSDEKKRYDSNMETIGIINSRRPNLIKAEEEALIRLNGENIKLQQLLGSKLLALEEEYNKFLQDLDGIEQEYGINLLQKEKVEKTENPAPVFEVAPDLGEEEPVVEQLVPGFEQAPDLDEDKPEVEQPVPGFEQALDLDEDKPEVEQPVPGFEQAPDLDEDKPVVEQPVPGFEQAPDLDEDKTVVEQPVPGFKQAPDLDEDKPVEEQSAPVFDIEEPVIKPLNKINIEIGKNGKSVIAIEREGAKVAKGKERELSNEKFFDTISKKYPEADKWVIREIASVSNHKGNKEDDEKLLEEKEAKEQLEIYNNIMNGKDVEENKKKLKIDLKYDLTGLKGLNRNTKKEIKANAKKAEKLGIAEVETYWSKFTNFVWDKVYGWVTSGLDKLPKAKEPERISAPDDTQRSDTAENISYEDRLIADLESKGAFNTSWKPKKPGELSPEDKKIQQDIAKTVAEAMNEEMQSSVENDGVEQEQK